MPPAAVAYQGRLDSDDRQGVDEFTKLNGQMLTDVTTPTFDTKTKCEKVVKTYVERIVQWSERSADPVDSTSPAPTVPDGFCDHMRALQACLKDAHKDVAVALQTDKTIHLPFVNDVAREAKDAKAAPAGAGAAQ